MKVTYSFIFGEAKVFVVGDEGSESVWLTAYSDDNADGVNVNLSGKDAEKLGAALFHLARTTEATQ